MSVGRYRSATERMMGELTNTKQRHQELFGTRLPPAAARSVLQEAMDSLTEMNSIGGKKSVAEIFEKSQGSLSALEKATLGISDRSLISQYASGVADEFMGSGAERLVRQLALENYDIPASSAAEAATKRPKRLPPPPPPRKTPGHTIKHAADIGPLIRDARKYMNMTQTDFAAHAGVGRRFLSELESGKPSLEFDKVMACAEAAGIDLIARLRSNT